MADTIYLPNGKMEVIFGDPVDTVRRLVREYLGPDAERIITDLQEERSDAMNALKEEMRSYESTVEAQRVLLQDTMESLFELMADAKNKATVSHLQKIHDHIYKNL